MMDDFTRRQKTRGEAVKMGELIVEEYDNVRVPG